MTEQVTEIKKGNPIASMRFRWQTYTKDTDEPLESEWARTERDAIISAQSYLIRQYKKFGKDELVVKVFNEMNYKKPPFIITLQDAFIPYP